MQVHCVGGVVSLCEWETHRIVVPWFILDGVILVNLLGCGSVWVGEIGLRQVGVGLTSVVRRLTKGGGGHGGGVAYSFMVVYGIPRLTPLTEQ